MTHFSAPHPVTAAGSLQGKRVVVTRAREQSKGLIERLQNLGAEVVGCPAITIVPPESYAPLDEAITRLDSYDWVIFASANGVEAFAARLAQVSVSREVLAGRKLCAVGPATTTALRKIGCEPGLVPSAYVSEAIVEEIGDIKGQRVLLPSADIARKTLAEGLRGKGAHVDEVIAYRTVADEATGLLVDLLKDDKVDAITFTSSSTVRNTVDNLAESAQSQDGGVKLLNRTKVVCIGPATAGTARELGVRVDTLADEHTTDGLVAALAALFAGEHKGKGVEAKGRIEEAERNA